MRYDSLWQKSLLAAQLLTWLPWKKLTLSIFSPWQWFASTRSLVNGIEASLTVAALVHWPWSWMKERLGAKSRQDDHSKLIMHSEAALFVSNAHPDSSSVLYWLVLLRFYGQPTS